jgi:hypothetical protein
MGGNVQLLKESMWGGVRTNSPAMVMYVTNKSNDFVVTYVTPIYKRP